jgi:hypothetical protein
MYCVKKHIRNYKYGYEVLTRFMKSSLTLKILSDQIWVAGYFGQPLTYPYFTILSSGFLCNSLKS